MTRTWLYCAILSFVLIFSLANGHEIEGTTTSPYRIVIDGGSTGSRLHIFEFLLNNETNETECIGRGSLSVWTPLSDFANASNNPHAVAEHLFPLFDFAATNIPSRYHASTTVTYQGTAGMRLLHPQTQQDVYDALYEGLQSWPHFVFSSLQRHHIATLDGNEEAYFAAVAANYLHGTVTANLTRREPSQQLLGALDMGGSSTQIVFRKEQQQQQQQHSRKLHPTHFSSTSYLSFGAQQFRTKLWDDLSSKYHHHHNNTSIHNPCAFSGHITTHNAHTFVGTGNATHCAMHINNLLPHHELHTPPHNAQTNFLAMSLYFFALDCLKEISLLFTTTHPSYAKLHDSWPNPSIQELTDALDPFCLHSWHHDLQPIQHHAHKYTSPNILPHRCFEAVYIVTLLRDGYKFPLSSRSITFAHLLHGNQVEWSLGMALSLHDAHHHHHHESSLDVVVVVKNEEDICVGKNSCTLEDDCRHLLSSSLS